jgi:hypothetical protein
VEIDRTKFQYLKNEKTGVLRLDQRDDEPDRDLEKRSLKGSSVHELIAARHRKSEVSQSARIATRRAPERCIESTTSLALASSREEFTTTFAPNPPWRRAIPLPMPRAEPVEERVRHQVRSCLPVPAPGTPRPKPDAAAG